MSEFKLVMNKSINLKILQWNCRDIRGKIYEMERIATKRCHYA